MTVTTAGFKPRVQSTVCTGAAGTGNGALIVTVPVAADVQPEALVTVKVYDPDGISARVVVVPEPVLVIPPGSLVSVHMPVDGNPLNPTLPVVMAQVG